MGARNGKYFFFLLRKDKLFEEIENDNFGQNYRLNEIGKWQSNEEKKREQLSGAIRKRGVNFYGHI